MTQSGSTAQRGDIVQNITTKRVGKVIGASQFGRIIVELSNDGTTVRSLAVWERYNTIVLSKGDN